MLSCSFARCELELSKLITSSCVKELSISYFVTLEFKLLFLPCSNMAVAVCVDISDKALLSGVKRLLPFIFGGSISLGDSEICSYKPNRGRLLTFLIVGGYIEGVFAGKYC